MSKINPTTNIPLQLPLAEDRRVLESLALPQKRLDRRDDLVGHLIVFGVRRERVIDREDAETRFAGGDDGSAQHRRRAIHHVRAAVGVDENLAVVLPVMRTDIQHRNAAELQLFDNMFVALQQGLFPSASAQACSFFQPPRSPGSGNLGI
jgi:hypothetical protein